MKSTREKEQHRRECFSQAGSFPVLFDRSHLGNILWAVVRIETNGVFATTDIPLRDGNMGNYGELVEFLV